MLRVYPDQSKRQIASESRRHEYLGSGTTIGFENHLRDNLASRPLLSEKRTTVGGVPVQESKKLAIGIHCDPRTPQRFGRINCGYFVAFEIPGSEGTRTGTQFIAIHADGVSVQAWDEGKCAHRSIRQREFAGLGGELPPIPPYGVSRWRMKTQVAIDCSNRIDNAPLAKQHPIRRPERIMRIIDMGRLGSCSI